VVRLKKPVFGKKKKKKALVRLKTLVLLKKKHLLTGKNTCSVKKKTLAHWKKHLFGLRNACSVKKNSCPVNPNPNG
jgi:hypothetical protein